jgi:hypothetical protein
MTEIGEWLSVQGYPYDMFRIGFADVIFKFDTAPEAIAFKLAFPDYLSPNRWAS